MRQLPVAPRSVRSTLSDAVGARLGATAGPAGRHATPEGMHRDALRALLDREGPAGVVDCGRTFAMSTGDPLVAFLATSEGPLQLAHRYRRIEPMFHLGHATETTVTSSTMTFRHVARLGSPPSVPETLLVFGATVGMFLRLGAPELSVALTDATGVPRRVWPPDDPHAFDGAEGPLSWTLRWVDDGSWAQRSGAGDHEELRALIAARPERAWDVRAAADAMAVSPRTLQRRLHAVGTTIREIVVAGRIDAATALLVRTSLDATTVALACGFADLPHLTHHFRRRHGHPPGRYRRVVRAEV